MRLSGLCAGDSGVLVMDLIAKIQFRRSVGKESMAMPYRTLEKMSAERRAQMTQEALTFLDGGDKRQGANQFALNL